MFCQNSIIMSLQNSSEKIISDKMKPKKIHVFMNGNPSGRVFFIRPKCRLTWSALINFMSDFLNPFDTSFLNLRKTNGKIVSSYEELEDNGKYVACGKELIIKIPGGYRTESETRLQLGLSRKSFSESIKSFGSDISNSTDSNQNNFVVIYVFINGRKEKPYRIVLSNADLEEWSSVYAILGGKLNIYVFHLYTIFGEKLQDLSEIKNKGFYVAVLEGDEFENVPYLSVFSSKSETKLRLNQTMSSESKTELDTTKVEKIYENTFSTNFKELSSDRGGSELILQNCAMINLNDSTSDSPCIHLTIVQKSPTEKKRLLGDPEKICGVKPSARIVLEMLSDKEYSTYHQLCKGTQTTAVFCEALPKGECIIEVASKKFHIICDDDTIVLPCGTYFSSHRSMKKPCSFPSGNTSISLEDIANHIVGIVVDTSAFCAPRTVKRLELDEKSSSKLTEAGKCFSSSTSLQSHLVIGKSNIEVPSK